MTNIFFLLFLGGLVVIVLSVGALFCVFWVGVAFFCVAIENISLTRDCFEVFGKNEDTISFMVNDIKYIQLKCKEGNQLYDFLQSAWDDNDSITFNIVGKPSINEYNGIRTPQIIIEDVAVISTNSNDEDDDW